MWLKDRVCLNCGSSLVQWRHKEPHCFNCGANVPFEEMEVCEIGTNHRMVDFDQKEKDGDGYSIQTHYDHVLLLARALI